MKVRRPWAAALALSMALGLAACGGEGADAPTPSVEVTAEATVEPTVTPTAAPTAAPTLEATPGPAVEATAQPSAQPVELREYTLTEIDLPEGWRPTASSYSVADGWTPIQRIENGQVAEMAIYRSDGALFTDVLEGGSPYVGEGPASAGNTWYACLRKEVRGPGSIDFDEHCALFDVKEGKLAVPYQPYETYRQSAAAIRSQNDRPQPKEDEATWLWGYVDEAGNWVIPAQYTQASPFQDGVAVVSLLSHEIGTTAIDPMGKGLPLPRRYSMLFYLGDGMFNYWGENWENDCGLVSIDGVETPTETFKFYFNGGLTANHGLIAAGHESGWNYVYAYYDYAGNQVSEAFDWAGPIGDDGAGFVCKDDRLYRIQF